MWVRRKQMNKKLEIELFRYESLLFGKVLHMDEDLRGAGTLYKGRLIEIYSDAAPQLVEIDPGTLQLMENVLFVRGSAENCDNDVFGLNYEDEKKAIEIAKDIENGINFINREKINKDSSAVRRVI